MLIIFICILVMILLWAECVRELHCFGVTRYQVSSHKFQSMTKPIHIVFLSDLHNKCYGNNNESLFEAIKEEKPDMILIGGDMLIGKKGHFDEHAINLIKRLPAICPVYHANGNHEQRMKERPEKYGFAYEEYQNKLQTSGIRFLENETTDICLNGVSICIYGFENDLDTYEKFKTHALENKEIVSRIGEAKEQSYNILLAHNPVFFPAYKKWGADLVLSGHLHGGIARIPGFRGCITPQAFLFPKYSGEMTTEGDSSIIVSKGLGTHTVNIRLFNKAEVVSITLHN